MATKQSSKQRAKNRRQEQRVRSLADRLPVADLLASIDEVLGGATTYEA